MCFWVVEGYVMKYVNVEVEEKKSSPSFFLSEYIFRSEWVVLYHFLFQECEREREREESYMRERDLVVWKRGDVASFG